MAQLIDGLKNWIAEVINTLGYWGIVLIMALENIFPPIPSELVLPFAGFLAVCGGDAVPCEQAPFTLLGVILAGTVGSVLGAVVLYYLGLWADERVIRNFVRRFGRWLLLSEKDLDQALDYFSRYGEAVVFFGRLIPLVRSLVSIPAGMQRMPLGKFLLFTALGTGFWSALLASAGYWLGANWEQVLGVIERYQSVVLVLIGLGVLYFLYQKLIQPRMNS